MLYFLDTPSAYCDRDPAPLFFDRTVQELLQQMTGLDVGKVYKTVRTKLSEPKYQFVTDSELNKMLDTAKEKAKVKLQMPPIVQERKPITEVISYDPELQGFENCTVVFTDVTFGSSDRARLIVARDADGTLRQASWDERERMHQIFFPREGKKLTVPKMFLDEHLLDVLSRQQYEFVLDRACIQFEPDDPIYIRVTSKVYDHIDATRAFDALRSTRHFGPMTFYFVFHRKMDNLLVDMIQREKMDDAVRLVQLFHILHPACKSLAKTTDLLKQVDFVRAYSENDSAKRNNIELALRSHEELVQQRREYEDEVQKAQGQTK